MPPQEECVLLLDVVVRQRPAILKLVTSEGQTLLVRRNSFLVLDFGLDIVNGVKRIDDQGDFLDCENFDEDLHASVETQHTVEHGLLLDVVVRQHPSIFKLLSRKAQPLLVRRDSLLFLDLCLDSGNCVGCLDQ